MINLADDILKDFVNTLIHDDPELKPLLREAINNVDGDGVENSTATAKWDNRYNSLVKVAKKYVLKFGIIKRGNLWKAIFIVGEDNSIYVFFNHKNLKGIIKKGKSNHYLKLLNFFNRHLDDHKPINEQLKWDLEETTDPYSDEALENQARDIIKMLEHEPSKVVVFAFNKSFISTVNAYVFNSKHEPIWHQDFTSLIESNYAFDLNSDDIETEKKESTTTIDKKKQIVKLKKIK